MVFATLDDYMNLKYLQTNMRAKTHATPKLRQHAHTAEGCGAYKTESLHEEIIYN